MSHSLPWFRFYDEALDDPKVQMLAGQTFKLWVNMLCLANRGSPRGFIKGPVQDIAFSLRLDASDAAACIQELIDSELLVKVSTPVGDGWEPWNWHGRQFQSDDKSQYWRAWYEKQRHSREDLDANTSPNIGSNTHQVFDPNTGPILDNPNSNIGSNIVPNIGSNIIDTDIDSDKDKDSESDADISVDDFDRMLSAPLPESLAEARSVMSLPKKEKKLRKESEETFEWFWEHYPRDKEGLRPGTKAAALREWRRLPSEEQDQVPQCLEAYRNTRKVRDGYPVAAQRFLAEGYFKEFQPDYSRARVTRETLVERAEHQNGKAEGRPLERCQYKGCEEGTYRKYCATHGVFPRFEELKPEYSESIPEEEEEMF